MVRWRAGFGAGGINRQFLPQAGEATPAFNELDHIAAGVWHPDVKGPPVSLTGRGLWSPPCRSMIPNVGMGQLDGATALAGGLALLTTREAAASER